MTQALATALDHAVINTQYDMDAAQSCFTDLGFSLTERGYHSLGSINHLMMFGTDYLELIGLPTAATDGQAQLPVRAGISDAPLGINGIVFKTDDAQQTYEHLQRIGMDGDQPNSFSRPVQLAGAEQIARFRTVHVRRDLCDAGRIYFCEHLTPELVWQPGLSDHRSTVSAIKEVVLVSRNPEQHTETFTTLLNAKASTAPDVASIIELKGFRLVVQTPGQYTDRFGELACELGSRPCMFGSMTFAVEKPDALLAVFESLDWPHAQSSPGAWNLRQPDFDCLFRFEPT